MCAPIEVELLRNIQQYCITRFHEARSCRDECDQKLDNYYRQKDSGVDKDFQVTVDAEMEVTWGSKRKYDGELEILEKIIWEIQKLINSRVDEILEGEDGTQTIGKLYKEGC